MNLGKDGFGNNLSELTEQMANASLMGFFTGDFFPTWAVMAGVVLIFILLTTMWGGVKLGFAGNNVAKARDAKQTISNGKNTFIAALLIPTLLTLLLMAVEVGKRVASRIGRSDDWYNAFDALQLLTKDVTDYLISKWWGSFSTMVIQMELDAVRYVVPTFSFLILFFYVFRNTRWGELMLKLSIGIAVGLPLAVPIQVAVLAGASRISDLSVGVAMFAVFLSAFVVPIVSIIGVMVWDPYTRLSGGQTSVDGDVNTSPDNDKPESVVVENDVTIEQATAATISVDAMMEPTTQQEFTSSMEPQVEGGDPNVTLLEQRFSADGGEAEPVQIETLVSSSEVNATT